MAPDPIKLPARCENTPEECDAVLGLYMRAWNQLELQTFTLFQKLLDSNVTTASIVFNAGINQNTMRNILDAIGKQRLNGADYKTMTRLLHRMKDAATIRNHLIHGIWQLNLTMGDIPRQAEKAEWVRFYQPTDPASYDAMFGKKRDQKLLAKHVFSLARIKDIAGSVDSLAREVGMLSRTSSLLPVHIPQPVF